MIIPEDNEQPRKGGPPPREPEQTVEPAQPPPAYPGEPSYQAGTSSMHPLYGPPQPSPTTQDESAGKRFFKAFVIALVIWTLFAAFVRSVAELGRHAGTRERVSVSEVLKCLESKFWVL